MVTEQPNYHEETVVKILNSFSPNAQRVSNLKQLESLLGDANLEVATAQKEGTTTGEINAAITKRDSIAEALKRYQYMPLEDRPYLSEKQVRGKIKSRVLLGILSGGLMAGGALTSIYHSMIDDKKHQISPVPVAQPLKMNRGLHYSDKNVYAIEYTKGRKPEDLLISASITPVVMGEVPEFGEAYYGMIKDTLNGLAREHKKLGKAVPKSIENTLSNGAESELKFSFQNGKLSVNNSPAEEIDKIVLEEFWKNHYNR